MLASILLDGLGLGAIYAFIALGYTMVYGIIRLINFAHGEFFMVGGFVGWFVLRDSRIDELPLPQPLPLVLAILAALAAAGLAAGLLAIVTERLAYRPVRHAGRIAALLTAVGVSFFLQNLAIQVWGAGARAYPEPSVWVDVDDVPSPADANYRQRGELAAVLREGEPVTAERRAELKAAGVERVARPTGITKEGKQGFVLVLLVLLAPVLWFLVQRTRMGRAMRAVSEDPDAAQLMGINLDRVVAWTFFLGAVLAGIGGVAFCSTYGSVKPLTGWIPGLKAFIAAVIGGIGSIPGALVGGLLLGVAEFGLPWLLEQAGWSEAKAFQDALAYVFLIVVLLVRPTGLLGQPLREKV
ncbi:MAG: branched-chain amino acid ABC transporter permease [Planctomycetes bacterium]|nr:branched-chain amino acid ABC transporter permease [Planctomycetota bacterium]MCB9902315.1 branched-chain amino acid ABC transporter permease [Planctomycetota bacterium]